MDNPSVQIQGENSVRGEKITHVDFSAGKKRSAGVASVPSTTGTERAFSPGPQLQLIPVFELGLGVRD